MCVEAGSRASRRHVPLPVRDAFTGRRSRLRDPRPASRRRATSRSRRSTVSGPAHATDASRTVSQPDASLLTPVVRSVAANANAAGAPRALRQSSPVVLRRRFGSPPPRTLWRRSPDVSLLSSRWSLPTARWRALPTVTSPGSLRAPIVLAAALRQLKGAANRLAPQPVRVSEPLATSTGHPGPSDHVSPRRWPCHCGWPAVPSRRGGDERRDRRRWSGAALPYQQRAASGVPAGTNPRPPVARARSDRQICADRWGREASRCEPGTPS